MPARTTYNVDLVALHITPVCGHACPYCYMSGVKARRPRHPDYRLLCRIVDALSEADVREITFLGGDPGVYSRAVDLARYCCDLGLTVSVLSNTHRYPTSSVEEATKYVSAFETTVHAPTAREHDAFCGRKGAFDGVVSRLCRASALGRSIGIAINVIPDIAPRMFETARALKEDHRLDLDYIIVQRIIPQGRAQETSEFTINREHAETALEQIERIDRELGIKISVEDPFPLCILPARLRKYMSPCQWGFTKAAVSDQGGLSRCGADPRCRLGNILETPLLEIWNSSDILTSFRERKYLPGRCQTCPDLARCGGGCPLSCEIERDHGLDYLFLEYQRLDQQIHGQLTFELAGEEELASVLQIEWSDFPEYGHVFSVSSLREWYLHNPAMFHVVRDSKNWVMAYACIVPVTERLHKLILQGRHTALTEFPKDEVLRCGTSEFVHIEVVASVPARSSSRVGRLLVRKTGEKLLGNAAYVTASPVTDIGVRLCRYFGFEHVVDEDVSADVEERSAYPVYLLRVVEEDFRQRVERF